MRALTFDNFQSRPYIAEVPKPECPADGVLIQVEATGLCRSDWHGWMGHDDMIQLPHVPGHEFAGTISEVGTQVKRFQAGERVTAPFVCGCGHCEYCDQGDQQVCPHQTQPGFTHWGSFAEYVAIHQADVNLVQLPESMSGLEAASLGCRFATSFRAIVDQGQLRAGESIAIFGCGGVGLSALLIAKALQARVIAVDVSADTLQKAKSLGADEIVNAAATHDVSQIVRELTNGGVHISVDALGSLTTFHASLESLRKRGRHLQIGLMTGEHARPETPMGRVIADELQLFGCHGMQAHRYSAMFELIHRANIPLGNLIERTISLEEAIDYLPEMSRGSLSGMTMIRVEAGR